MDIEVIVRRATVFAGLFVFVYTVFTGFVVVGQELFKNVLGWNQWLALVPTVLVITFALKPLDNFLTNATEKFLFQKKYDYRDLLRTFTQQVLTVIDLHKIATQTVQEMIRIVKLESCAVLLLNKEKKQFYVAASQGVKDTKSTFPETSPMIHLLNTTQLPIVRSKAVERIQGEKTLKDDMKSLNAYLVVPMILHKEVVGILALGMKKSGEDFIPEDLDILSSLANTEAIAISNAQLFDELSKTQAEAAQSEKMAVIGTLAAGINHEICNPLGIARGQCEMFTLNLRDGIYRDKEPQEVINKAVEIMNKVIHETDRAAAITKRLSTFAKPSKADEMEGVDINREVDEVLALLGYELKMDRIDVTKKIPSDLPIIRADRKQVQEIFFNIIRNAAQAITGGGKIHLSAASQNGSIHIDIADTGCGIPEDKLDEIFNPFYTTKAPGKGTGLGLFIVKKVVEKNNGQISVKSTVGEGTTFTLEFPTAQKEAVAGDLAHA